MCPLLYNSTHKPKLYLRSYGLLKILMERVKGIEPSSSDWKSEALAIELHPQTYLVTMYQLPGVYRIARRNPFHEFTDPLRRPSRERFRTCLSGSSYCIPE